MKKKMKKAVSLIGTLAMTASLAVPVSYAETAAVTNGTTLEMENFLSQNADKGFGAVEKETAHGGGYVYLNPTADYETQTYTVTFEAEKQGSYTLEVGASERGANDWISPVKMTVNGEDYGFLWNADNTAGGFVRGDAYASHLFEGGEYKFRTYQTKNEVNLLAGENTITFTAYPANNNSWNNNGTQQLVGAQKLVGAGFDYITFSKEALPEVAANTTIEAEACMNQNAGSGFGVHTSDTAFGGAYVFMDPNYDIEPNCYTMAVNVLEDGKYNLEIGASERGSSDWISPVEVSINGAVYSYLWNADNTEDKFERAVRGYTAHGDFKFNKYRSKLAVDLPQGENVITFKGYRANNNSWNNNGTQQLVGAGALVGSGFDYVTFSKVAARKITSGETVELEEFSNLNAGSNQITANELSDGKAAAVGGSTTDAFRTFSFAVDADVAGDYYISAGVAERGAADWLSPVKLTVNGTDVGYFMKADYNEDGFSCTQLNYAAVDVYKFHRYASKAPVALRQGENQITYTIYNANQNSFHGNSTGTASQIYAALDYMTFNKVKTLSGVTMTVSDTLAVDGVSEIVLKDGDGSVIKPSDVAQITYSSSLETVATVTAEGKVTGVKPGRTRIDAEIRVNPGDTETIVVSAWVTVVEDEVFVANVQIAEGGKINFDVVNNTEFDDYENIKAIAASYLDGKMKSVASFSIGELLCGTNVSCEMTLNGYEDGDDVMIYVWNGLDTMVPVMTEKKAY